jgi:FtsH-binding integral membrane protein
MWQPRFTIFGLMLSTLVISVAAAAVGYLVRNQGKGRFGQLLFLLITLAGPLVVVILVSLARMIFVRLSRPAKKRR